MKNRAFPYLSIILSLIISLTVALIFDSDIMNIILGVICSLFVAVICLFTKHSENGEIGNYDKWLNCIFLLENYEINEKSRAIVVNYLETVKRVDNSPPPIHYATKLNRLLKAKGISEVNYWISDSLYIFSESLGLGLTTFGLCGMISTAIKYFNTKDTLSTFFWVSFVVLIIGAVISVFLVGDVEINLIPAIISSVIVVGLIISIISVYAVRVNEQQRQRELYDRQCYNIDIVISEKLSHDDRPQNNGYVSSFNMSVTNDKKDNIVEICGEMHIYNLQGDLLDASTLRLTGNILSGDTAHFVIDVDRPYSEEAVELYYSIADDLRITYKISYIIFEGWTKIEYPDCRLMEILTLPESSKVTGAISSVETTYLKGVELYNAGQYEMANEVFLTISAYKTSSNYIYLCEQGINEKKNAAIYAEAIELMNSAKYSQAIEKLRQIINYKDSAAKIKLCEERHQKNKDEAQYQKAQALYDKKNYVEAYKAFYKIKDYKDSTDYLYSILDDVNTLAESYVDSGNYSAAYDLLKSMGYTTSQRLDNYSKLMHACQAAKSGNYSSAALLGLTKIVVPAGTTTIRASAFRDCTTIVEIVIPESVTSIEEYAFSGCRSLEKLVLPQGLKSIGVSAFVNCDSLEKLVLPASLETIGIYGLNNFDGEIHYEGTMAQWRAVNKTGSPVPLKKTVYCNDGNVNP